jgi:hypothetical protein
MGSHGLLDWLEGLLEEVCFFGNLFLEVTYLMDALAD